MKKNCVQVQKAKGKTWHHLARDFDFFVSNQTWKLLHFLQAIRLDSPMGSSPSASECTLPEAKKPCLPFWEINPVKNASKIKGFATQTKIKISISSKNCAESLKMLL